jgi:hypothetical protein
VRQVAEEAKRTNRLTVRVLVVTVSLVAIGIASLVVAILS